MIFREWIVSAFLSLFFKYIIGSLISLLGFITNKKVDIVTNCKIKPYPLKFRGSKDIYFKIDKNNYDYCIIINPNTTLFYGLEYAIVLLDNSDKYQKQYNKKIEIKQNIVGYVWLINNYELNYFIITDNIDCINYGLLCLTKKSISSLWNSLNLIIKWLMNCKKLSSEIKKLKEQLN